MPISLSRIDPLSEMLAMSSYRNTKNLIISLVEVTGPLDADSLAIAANVAGDKFPQLRTCLKEVKEKGRYHLCREPRPDMVIPFRVIEPSTADSSERPVDIFMRDAARFLDRDWDLFTRLPVEMYLMSVSERRHILGPVLHHSAGDAAMASEVGREILCAYEEIIFGEHPFKAGPPPAVSTAKKRRISVKKKSVTDYLKGAKSALAPVIGRRALPVGTGERGDKEQYHVKRVWSEEETEAIQAKLSAARASLVDGLVSATHLAVDQWNRDRKIPPGALTTSMTVNMRGRYRDMENPNTSGLLYFRSEPHERRAPEVLARSISLARIKQFRRQMDFNYYDSVAKMNDALRLLPFKAKRRIVHFVAQRHSLSVAVTLLGVIWPAMKNGKPTGSSSLTKFADLNIEEVHGTGYKLLSGTHTLLIVYVYSNRLNFFLVASACHFTRREAEDFLDLVLESLKS